jgi:hypothetical protein
MAGVVRWDSGLVFFGDAFGRQICLKVADSSDRETF